MRRTLLGILAGALAVGVWGAVTYARRPIPGPMNAFLKELSRDVSFIDVPLEQAEPTLSWQVELPWGRAGLARLDMGSSVRVGPGETIAVGSGGQTLVFSREGALLWSTPLPPIGFLDNGTLAVGVRTITLYSPQGDPLWRADPWSVLAESLDLPLEGDWVYDTSVEAFTVSDQVYWHADFPGESTETDWEVVYDQEGAVLSSGRQTLPGFPVATAAGGLFVAAVPLENGYAHREFVEENGSYRLRRTLTLPSYRILEVSRDGQILGMDRTAGNAHQERFTVYMEKASRALTFELPSDEWSIGTGPDHTLYSIRSTDGALVVRCWEWPTP